MDRTDRRGRRPDELFDHSLPHDIDAACAVLAVLLLDPSRIPEMAEVLVPADFGDNVSRNIYAAMLRLHSAGKPIDIALLVGELRDRGQYGTEDGVSAATLLELFRLFPLVRHLPYYVERVAPKPVLNSTTCLLKASSGRALP